MDRQSRPRKIRRRALRLLGLTGAFLAFTASAASAATPPVYDRELPMPAVGSPLAVAVASDGNLLVTDQFTDMIRVMSPSGTQLSTIGSTGTGNGQLKTPSGIAVDASGNIFVADSANNRVQKFSSAGVWLQTIGSVGAGNGQFNAPRGVAVDAAGKLYVADYGNFRVQVFDASGAFVRAFQNSTSTSFPGVLAPWALTVDSLGYVYVTYAADNQVIVFNGGTGSQVRRLTSPGATGNTVFDSPRGITLDSSGNLHVVDGGTGKVQIVSKLGILGGSYGAPGSGTGQFTTAHGIAFKASTNEVFVVDSSADKIVVFSGAPPVVVPEASLAALLPASALLLSLAGFFVLRRRDESDPGAIA
jgi:DNA-binding beta-propeller fold protein YncE